MRIIIDGYNVLKKIYHDEFISDQLKMQFFNELHYYGKKRGHEIVVIFDGGVLSYPERIMHKDVTVIYAGANQAADDYIVEYISRKKGEQLLVSSDRQLCSDAAQHEVVSIDAHIFYTIVVDTLKRAGEKIKRYDDRIKKTTDDSSSEIDLIMQEASLSIHVKKEDMMSGDDGQTKRMSMLERKLAAIIKKL